MPSPPELPFEPFLVLPRKSERLLMAAGLMQPLPWHPLELRMAPGLRWNSLGVLPHQGPQADGAAEAKLGARDGPRRPPESLRDVMAIASWLHSEQKGAVTDLAAPLLCAAYQRAISPDDLYDLYKMDMGGYGIAIIMKQISKGTICGMAILCTVRVEGAVCGMHGGSSGLVRQAKIADEEGRGTGRISAKRAGWQRGVVKL